MSKAEAVEERRRALAHAATEAKATGRAIRKCFWTWPFGHVLVPGVGKNGHPAYVCANCPKAIEQLGWEWCDASPKRDTPPDLTMFPDKWQP